MGAMRDYFICSVADHKLAIAADAVSTVLPMLPLWRAPTLPAAVVGFAEIRGGVLPVIATAVVLGWREAIGAVDGFSHILCLSEPSATWPCLLIDRVEERRAVDPDAIAPVDPVNSLNGVVTAEIALDDGVAHVIDLDRLLDSFERERLEQMTEMARARADHWAEPTSA
ncbi:chemotaxis protein CheW [Sphingomonas aestuarii]